MPLDHDLSDMRHAVVRICGDYMFGGDPVHGQGEEFVELLVETFAIAFDHRRIEAGELGVLLGQGGQDVAIGDEADQFALLIDDRRSGDFLFGEKAHGVQGRGGGGQSVDLGLHHQLPDAGFGRRLYGFIGRMSPGGYSCGLAGADEESQDEADES